MTITLEIYSDGFIRTEKRRYEFDIDSRIWIMKNGVCSYFNTGYTVKLYIPYEDREKYKLYPYGTPFKIRDNYMKPEEILKLYRTSLSDFYGLFERRYYNKPGHMKLLNYIVENSQEFKLRIYNYILTIQRFKHTKYHGTPLAIRINKEFQKETVTIGITIYSTRKNSTSFFYTSFTGLRQKEDPYTEIEKIVNKMLAVGRSTKRAEDLIAIAMNREYPPFTIVPSTADELLRRGVPLRPYADEAITIFFDDAFLTETLKS